MNNEEFAQKNTCCLKKVLVTGASGFIEHRLKEKFGEDTHVGIHVEPVK